jgi:hypothetical protein
VTGSNIEPISGMPIVDRSSDIEPAYWLVPLLEAD